MKTGFEKDEVDMNEKAESMGSSGTSCDNDGGMKMSDMDMMVGNEWCGPSRTTVFCAYGS